MGRYSPFLRISFTHFFTALHFSHFAPGLTGAIRGFVLVGMLTGSVIEHLTVGNAVVSVLRSLFSIIRKLFAKTFRLWLNLLPKEQTVSGTVL